MYLDLEKKTLCYYINYEKTVLCLISYLPVLMKIKRDIGKKRTVIGKDIVHENITYDLGKTTIINNNENKTG